MTEENEIQLAIAIPAVLGMLWGLAVVGFKIGLVLREVTPNGGNSMKDRIVKLEFTQADQTNRLVNIERKLDHSIEKQASEQTRIKGLR